MGEPTNGTGKAPAGSHLKEVGMATRFGQPGGNKPGRKKGASDPWRAIKEALDELVDEEFAKKHGIPDGMTYIEAFAYNYSRRLALLDPEIMGKFEKRAGLLVEQEDSETIDAERVVIVRPGMTVRPAMPGVDGDDNETEDAEFSKVDEDDDGDDERGTNGSVSG